MLRRISEAEEKAHEVMDAVLVNLVPTRLMNENGTIDQQKTKND